MSLPHPAYALYKTQSAFGQGRVVNITTMHCTSNCPGCHCEDVCESIAEFDDDFDKTFNHHYKEFFKDHESTTKEELTQQYPEAFI